MNADSFQRQDAEAQRSSTTDDHRWTRIFNRKDAKVDALPIRVYPCASVVYNFFTSSQLRYAGDLKDSERKREALRISKVNESLDDGRRLHEFHAGAEEQHQRRQGAHDTSGPERLLRNGSRVR